MTSDPARTSTLAVAYMINFDATTGRFVGFGSLVDKDMVILHSAAVGALLAESPTSQLTVRMQIGDRSTGVAETVDGTVYPSDDGLELPPAVVLSRQVGHSAGGYVYQPMATLAALLAEDEASDPPTSPFPTPKWPIGDSPVNEQPGLDPPPQPGLRPPWCYPFPNTPGCR